jgi:uncharacterized protein
MGYIDCDTHVIETEQTWDYFDPSEIQFRPMMNDGYWQTEDHVVQWPGPMAKHWNGEVFPAVDLVDIPARLQYLDDFGVDAQMMFPTWWLLYPTSSPMCEAALHRSYNRWIAERASEAGGRLRWAVMAPVRMMDRALEEIEFGKEHGASSVFLLPQNHGMSLAEPSMFPLYEKAQDLDLAVTVHVGTDLRIARRDPGHFLYTGVMVLPGAFYALLFGRLADRFPRLKWGFMEGGSSWVPYVLRETFRADATGAYRGFKDWRPQAQEALEGAELFIAAQLEDDIAYVLEHVGPDCLVYGTDYGHLDLGSDPGGLHEMTHRPDIDEAVACKLVDGNARRLLGIDPAFTPAPAPTMFDLPAERISRGLPTPIGA